MELNSQMRDSFINTIKKNKKIVLGAGLLIVAVILLCIVFGGASPDFVISENPENKAHEKIDFFKNGEKVLSLEFAVPYRIGFMQKTADDGSDCTYTYEFIDSKTDFRNYLTDIKGDGDKRYLIVANYAGSSAAEPYEAYLLDTVDNFAVVGRIPADETIVYKKNNPALVFEFSEMIEDYNLLGSAQIKLPMQLIPAQGMTCVAVKADEIDLEPYKAMLKAPADGRSDNRAAALGKLYCELAGKGMLDKALKSARLVGFTDKEIVTGGGAILDKIRQSKFYKYVYELNGGRP